MQERRVPIIHIKAKSLHLFTFQTNYDKIVEAMHNYMLATTISVYFMLFSVSYLARKQFFYQDLIIPWMYYMRYSLFFQYNTV